ncbi:MAG: ROK family protein [Clostridiales Family XIII bacterium]|jgi:glucokinase|nr:ROK family protein [Clostridiales Family XIII bacterium]
MRYNIGIDLGGTNIVAGLVDEDGKILSKSGLPTLAGRPARAIAADLAALARDVAEKAGISPRDANSVGVGIPGSADKTTGAVEYACNLGWHDIPLRDMLSDDLGLPVYLANDANAAAYGEYIAGAAKGSDSFVMLTLGTGVGGGLILRGKIVEGFNSAGMEVGHMVIAKGGRPCQCGRSGCFERYASASGLILTAKEYMARRPSSLLWDLSGGDPDKVDGRMPFDAMKQGDPTAKEIVDVYIDDLACGLTSIINILQPEILALGGGIAAQGETLLAPLRTIVSREVYSRTSARNTRIAAAALGNDAGIVGAANLCGEARR